MGFAINLLRFFAILNVECKTAHQGFCQTLMRFHRSKVCYFDLEIEIEIKIEIEIYICMCICLGGDRNLSTFS